jgi:hypothetical protein
MGDGSWRLAVCQTPSGATQEVNTFIQRNGHYLPLLKPYSLPMLLCVHRQTFITFELRAEADLPAVICLHFQ